MATSSNTATATVTEPVIGSMIVVTAVAEGSTTSESNVTSTSATLNGDITSDGGETVTERGFVYSTLNADPEIGGANVIKESEITTEIGVFSKNITGLTAGTIYHYKAYAINSEGTSYGAVVSFRYRNR